MWQSLRKLGLIGRSVAIALLVLGLSLIIAPLAWYFSGVWGVSAMASAAALCLLGAIAALYVNQFFVSPKDAFMGILLGMGLGMGVPLMFGAVIHIYGGPLSQAGFLHYLLIFYLPTLAIKTILTLPLQRQTATDNNDP